MSGERRPHYVWYWENCNLAPRESTIRFLKPFFSRGCFGMERKQCIKGTTVERRTKGNKLKAKKEGA